jgi:hypothetical protein
MWFWPVNEMTRLFLARQHLNSGTNFNFTYLVKLFARTPDWRKFYDSTYYSFSYIHFSIKGKGKAVPVTGREGP